MHDLTPTRPRRPLAPGPGRRRRLVSTALMLSLCLVLAACGGDDKNDDAADDLVPGPPVTEFSGDPNKACELATKAEVEAALATKVKPGVGALGTVCTYSYETAFDQFVVLERTDTPEARQIFEYSKSISEGVEPLPGVGNDAFVSGNKAYVLKGNVMATITVTSKQPPPAVGAAIRRLAQAAALHA